MNEMSGRPELVPLVDLACQQVRIRAQLDAAIARVLQHGQYVMGPEVGELERRLAGLCGARHAITCGSGTDALILALLAKGVRAGDAVIVPSFTFCATAEAVCLLGATPIFADVAEETYNLDPDSLKLAVVAARRLGLRPRAVISVDLFGQPCDYSRIEPVARESGLWLVCDAAQAFGAEYRGRAVGTIGDLTTVSFFPAKPLGCYGDGGAVFTDDDSLAEIVRSLRVHGQGADKYDNVRIGINGRLDTLQAAILLEKLGIFAGEIAAREAVAANYGTMLPGHVRAPVLADGARSVWAQYTIRSDARGVLQTRLKDRGVASAVYYRCPLHMQAAYRDFPRASDRLPVAERLAETVLSLPMHPYLSVADQSRVAAALFD